MSVLGTQRTILGGNGTVGILQSVQTLVNPGLDAVYGSHTAVPQTHVHHIEGFGVHVLSHLQVLVEAHAVAGAITPVHVLMTGTFLNGADGLLPVVGVLGRLLSLYKATAGETQELGMDIIEQLCQVGAQAVLAILEGGREEAHHVELNGTLAVCNECKLSLGIIGVGGELCGILGPFLSDLTADGSLCIYICALGVGETSLQTAFVVTLCPERELVGSALHAVDTPETLIDERCRGIGSGGNGNLECLSLSFVEEVLTDELRADLGAVLSGGLPCGNLLVVVLEGAVADQFGIETAIGSMVDVLEEDAI